ncbi:hypothetical protein QYF36_004730 [Acer negundo]|nr:hypothetical protein QYF36_004730 [Acer negundo]
MEKLRDAMGKCTQTGPAVRHRVYGDCPMDIESLQIQFFELIEEARRLLAQLDEHFVFLPVSIFIDATVFCIKIAEVDDINDAQSINSSEGVNSDVIFIVKEIKTLLKELGDFKCHTNFQIREQVGSQPSLFGRPLLVGEFQAVQQPL